MQKRALTAIVQCSFCVLAFAFDIYLGVKKSAQRMSVCECFAFLTYSLSLSFCLFGIYLCANRSAVKAQPRTLRILVNFDSLSTFYVGTSCLCFSLFLFVLRFSLVGSAHTRTLFVKSVAKTFVFLLYAVNLQALLLQVPQASVYRFPSVPMRLLLSALPTRSSYIPRNMLSLAFLPSVPMIRSR